MTYPTSTVAGRSWLGRSWFRRFSDPKARFDPRPRPWIACLCALGLLPVVSAEERGEVVPLSELKRMTVDELLDQEVVSVSRRLEPWGRAASSVFVIRGESANFVAATQLPELLRLAPQLFVARATSGDWGVSARGFMRSNSPANKMLVMVDGRTVYSPFFSNVFWDVQDVFLPDLDRIEVISGPAGVTWGANAVNGVINILTRSAHDTLGTAVVAGVGTEERYHFGVRHGARFGRDGAVRVWAQRRDTDSTLGPGGVEDDFDESVFSQAGFRADWGGTLTVQGDAYRLRSDIGDGPPERAEGANLLTRWSRDLTADSNVMLRLYHDYAMRDFQQTYVARTRTTDLEFQHRLQFGDRQQLLWGGHYRLMSDHVAQTAEDFAILPAELDFGLAGIFAQHDVRFADDLQLTSGLRIEHNEFSGWEWQPNLRLAWRPAKWSTLWISGSRTTRTPSRLETGFYAPRDPPHYIAGGPDVRSEELVGGEIGARWQTRNGISITTTAFYHEYDDLRSIAIETPIVQANGVAGRSRGVEAFLDWDATTKWRVRAGGFIVDQDTWVKPGHTDFESALGESSFPRFQVQLRNTWWLNDTLALWVAVRHVDDVPALRDDGSLSQVPAYTELDASLTWQLRPHIELSIIGRNLLDSAHPELGSDLSWREIERNVQAVLRCRF